MKACPHCGSTYANQVDFCFRDGTPLQTAAPSPAASSSAALESASLDVPEPRNLLDTGAFDVPEPRSVTAPIHRERARPLAEKERLDGPAPLAAPTLTPAHDEPSPPHKDDPFGLAAPSNLDEEQLAPPTELGLLEDTAVIDTAEIQGLLRDSAPQEPAPVALDETGPLPGATPIRPPLPTPLPETAPAAIPE
ncbi:MAG: hypothetical protein ACI8S6_005617, partial [Myxococcota bacterium]